MAERSISEFVDALAQSQLLTDAQLVTLRKQLVGNPITTEGLAKVLVSQEHLTGWQARQLRKGQTGFVLQQYRLLNPIGRGGMGHVFRARAANTERDVAVKVMARKLTGNETLVSRFRREIRASSKLDSKHIVRTLDAGRVGKIDFMVMEYVNGDQVDRIANSMGRVPVEVSCEIVRQTALGLQHAFERRMVHRDIKPANMMVHWEESGVGVAKLMDMGLVLLMSDEPDEKTVTRAGQVMGTPDYMSPEQGWDTTKVDIRSDIYSLGCTLFRLLTGKIPFTGSNPLQVLSQRLQRDAPSVLTVCDDISPELADVVSRMTMRDPDARYQTPQEVADALAPFSKALTLSDMRAAAKKAADGAGLEPGEITDDNGESDEDSSDASHEADGSYREFLREVEDGSVVDLMLASDPVVSQPIVDAPIIKLDLSPPPRKTGRKKSGRQKPKPTRSQKSGIVAMGVGTLVLAGVAMFAFSGGTPPAPAPVVPPPAPVVNITEAEQMTAAVGDTFTHDIEIEVTTRPATGELRFVAGSSAPATLVIEPTTGHIEWPIPHEQPAGDYAIPVSVVHVNGDFKEVLAKTSVSVIVERTIQNVKLPEPRRSSTIADAGSPFELPMAVEGSTHDDSQLKYELRGKSPEGIQIDAISGLVSWTPDESQIGLHALQVAVLNSKDAQVLDTNRVGILVLPTKAEHVLPKIVAQSATAGTQFHFNLPRSGLKPGSRIPLKRVIEPGPDAPPGLSISDDNDELRWQVPDDIFGTVRFSLLAKLSGPGMTSRNLTGSVPMEIQVAAAKPKDPTSQSTMPPAEEIAKALDELRTTYARTIAQARTTVDKALLANRLLSQCHDGEIGAADAALLQLIEEDLASKSRATDVLLQISRLRAERYGIDELAAAAETFKSFRATGLSQLQQDIVIEDGLRLCRDSITKKGYALTATILSSVKSMLSRSAAGAAGMLYADISSAEEIAGELSKQDQGATNAIRVEELLRLVNRWQFTPVFQNSSSIVYVQATTVQPIPREGRNLWTIEDDRISLTAEQMATLLGFVDTSQQRDRYVLRFELMPSSNCAQIVFAAAGVNSTDFNAHTIVLHAGALGRINALRNNVALNEGEISKRPQVFSDQPNQIEVAVDGAMIAVRLNGTPLSKAQIPGLAKGWLGIAADLRRPDPKLVIRHPRLLLLPENL